MFFLKVLERAGLNSRYSQHPVTMQNTLAVLSYSCCEACLMIALLTKELQNLKIIF